MFHAAIPVLPLLQLALPRCFCRAVFSNVQHVDAFVLLEMDEPCGEKQIEFPVTGWVSASFVWCGHTWIQEEVATGGQGDCAPHVGLKAVRCWLQLIRWV
jgi:hypothetical protein